MQNACNLIHLNTWLTNEIQAIKPAYQQVISSVIANIGDHVELPASAILLWDGCVRVKYHTYPSAIQRVCKHKGIPLDSRSNGPAITTFLLAGGARPKRGFGNNEWNIHHIYDGKFPYHGKAITTHAAKDGKHFSQSAGLIAVHPIAHALAHEFEAFAWYLRALAYNKFSYDPDSVFCPPPSNSYGFANNNIPKVIYP